MRIPVKGSLGGLVTWLGQLQRKVLELKPDNEKVQAKLRLLQASLQNVLDDQAKQQLRQIQFQKQIALLRSQIETASDANNIQPLAEKLKDLETDLTQLKSILPATDITTHLKTLQNEYLNLKKGSEQVAKFNSGLRTQLQSSIEESARQADKFTQWQKEFAEQLAQQNKQRELTLSELQGQLSQTKTALSKRLAALEGRVGNLEVKHTVLKAKQDAFVAKTDPTYTVGQKLLKLRQNNFEDKYISDELKYYVAPNGEAQPGGVREALYEWTLANFLDTKAEARVLLLQGQAGAGKSTFNSYLMCELWKDKAWDNFKPGGPIPKTYLPLFIPLGSKQVKPREMLNYYFDAKEIEVLKEKYLLLLIADGYDEIPGHEDVNLYDENKLHECKAGVKLIIGCRTERAQELPKTTFFMPHDLSGNPQILLFNERFMSPFGETQIETYIQKYVDKNKTHLVWKEAKIYQHHLERYPDLRKLIETPFLLRVTMEVLPQIVAESEQLSLETKGDKESQKKAFSVDKLTRALLLDKFVLNWFSQQAEKAWKCKDILQSPQKIFDGKPIGQLEQEFKLTGETGDLQIWLLKNAYQRFCQYFAQQLNAIKSSKVIYRPKIQLKFSSSSASAVGTPAWAQELFGDDDPDSIRCYRGSRPLLLIKQLEEKKDGSSEKKENGLSYAKEYEFIHPLLIDYFSTTGVWQAYKQRKENVTLPITQPRPRKMTKFEIKNPDETLNKELLTHHQISLFADRVTQDSGFKEYLFSLIERSKKEADIANASANAISVLNAARTSFSGMDFKGIRIPGADLSYAVMDSTQLEGADLSQVNFTGAWLRQVNFKQSKMPGGKWGERSFLSVLGSVSTCAYSLDGRWLAVGCDDDNIYLYDAKHHALQYTLKGHTKRITSVAFDVRSERLASGSDDNTVRLWQIVTGRLERTLEGHTKQVTSVAFDARDARSERLASGSADNTVRIWEVATGSLERTLVGHASEVMSVAFDPKGERLASGSEDKTVRLWYVATGRLERILEGHIGQVTSVAFDPKGECLASGSYDLFLWQVTTGRLVRTFERESRMVTSLAFDPKGERLASGSDDWIVRLWQVATGRLERTLEGHTSAVTSVAFESPKGEWLVSGSNDKTVRLWYVATGQLERTLEEPANYGENIVAIDYRGERLASGSQGKTICLWQVATGRLERIFEKHTQRVTSLAFDPKGERLASGSEDGTVCLWQVATGQLERTLEGHTKYVTSVAFDPKGERLASAGSGDDFVRLWQVATGRLERILVGHKHRVESYTFAKGEHLASKSWDEIVRSFNVILGQAEHIFTGHTNWFESWVESVAFDPKGEYLASGSRDNTVRVWQVATGRLECVLEGHAHYVTSVAFDPRGERIASGSRDSTVRLWRAATGRLERTLEGHTSYVTSIAFDPNGEHLASGGVDMTVHLWRAATGACLAVIQGFNGYVNCVSFQPTIFDLFLATGSTDKAIRYWQIDAVITSKKDKLVAMLRWTSHQAVLTAIDACMDDVIGLDITGRDLLQQRGAKGTPAQIKSSVVEKRLANTKGLFAASTRLGLLASPRAPISANTHPTTTEVKNVRYS